jgi:hypothetical protein
MGLRRKGTCDGSVCEYTSVPSGDSTPTPRSKGLAAPGAVLTNRYLLAYWGGAEDQGHKPTNLSLYTTMSEVVWMDGLSFRTGSRV